MLPAHQIGGAYVRRRVTIGTETRGPGDTLTREEVLEIPASNRNAMLNLKIIELFPSAPRPEGARRYAVHMGMGKWDVIEGWKLNDEPLTREDAEKLVSPDERPGARKARADVSREIEAD